MRRVRFALACSFLVVIAPVVSPALARAQDETPPPPSSEGGGARELFQRGQAAYAQGDYEDAIAQWTHAYELDPRPLLQFNLSQAYERLGRLQEAVDALQEYLDHADPNDEHQADARARQAALRERIAQTSVRVSGGPEGATILVDDEDRGRTPRPDPIQVSPGSHRIVVRASGYADFTSTVVVPAGQSVDVAVQMAAAHGAEEGGGEVPVLPIVLFSVGGAAIIAGAVLGGVALSDAQSAPARMSPEADTARALALGADINMGVGVACGVAGLIVLLVGGGGGSSDDEQAHASVSIAPWGGSTGGGLTIAGSF